MTRVDIGRNQWRVAILIVAPVVLLAALATWFVPVLVTGALAFAIGVFSFAQALSVTTVGGRALTRIVVVALVVMALSRVVPLAAVQFYVQGVAAIVALWPLAYAMRTQPAPYTAS